MRTLLIAASILALVFTLSACFQVIEIPFATDPRILRGAWSGQMDAACSALAASGQINSDNSRLVSSGPKAAIWSFVTGAKIATLELSAAELTDHVRWLSDAEVIGTVLAGNVVLVRHWRATDGRAISNIQLPRFTYNPLLSRDGSRYASTVTDVNLKRSALQVFDAAGNVISSASPIGTESPIEISDDGSRLFTSENSYSPAKSIIRIRSSATGAVLHNIDLNQRIIYKWAVRGQTLWGYDSDTGQLVRIDSSGAVTTQALKINQGINRFSVSPDARRIAVQTYEDVRVYNLSDLSAPLKTVVVGDFGTRRSSSLEWSADGQSLVLTLAEPRIPKLNPFDYRLPTSYSGVRCGLSNVSLGTAATIEFIESERESLSVSMQLEASYVSQQQYAISGTATIGVSQFTVLGKGYAEPEERLLTMPTPPIGQRIALSLKDAAGNTVWRTELPTISLPKRGLSTVPINALGLLERVSDGKQFLIDLERR